ncbi:hypothetical protein [Actinomadura monticuli]|uniref:Methyltransferase type 11 n=1 Tax=Actinomadura monticuli TaxID=3097367 RepID=A0ABV4QJ22_9ACTN
MDGGALGRAVGPVRDEWLDVVPTFGPHGQIPPDGREEVLAGIGAAVDEAGGAFTMRYATMATVASRVS